MSETADYGKTFQGFCSKLVGQHARLAGVLHLLEDQDEPVIPAETIERASRLTAFCIAHARAFYSRYGTSPIPLPAREHRSIGLAIASERRARVCGP